MQQAVRFPRFRLSCHVAAGLLLAGFNTSAIALSVPLQDAEQQRRLQSAWARGHHRGVAATVADGRGLQAPRDFGAAHTSVDRNAWRTDEFNADWGLAAINADAAYARGLTGQGIRLGVFDSGVDLSHPEFAEKNHRSLRLADLLPNGSRCAATQAAVGPDACAFTEGDQAFLVLTVFADDLPDSVRKELSEAYDFEPGHEFIAHGTHVAGTIAANRDGVGMHGVSFGSDLAVAKIQPDSFAYVDMNGGEPRVRVAPGRLKDGGLPQLYAQLADQGVRAVNHSWGFGPGVDPVTEAAMDDFLAAQENQPLIDTLARGSMQTGVIQVWAAGNHNDADLIPEDSPVAGLHASVPRARPDVEPYWLSVVNVNRNNVLDHSMRCATTAQWCIAAPGTGILSTVLAEDSSVDYTLIPSADGGMKASIKRIPTHGYDTYSGTSMAAPHVTGALGLLFERYPYLDNAQVRDVLLTTATDLGAPGVDEVYGWGLVNLERAIEGYGQLRVDTDVVMNQRAGGLQVWEGGAWDDWRNDIGGPGALTKSGVGWLRLSGNNRFNGATLREGILELDGNNAFTDAVRVEGGQLRLNGMLSSTDLDVRGGSALIAASGVLSNSGLSINNAVVSFNGVQAGGSIVVGVNGRLQGTGTLGTTEVSGTIAPGNSIGTLTINGDYVQTASGRYLAELAPGERSDLLRVSGRATLDGTLQAMPEPGTYYLGEQFRVLQAEGGVQGAFATADFSAFSPFLQFGLGYTPNEVNIDVTRGQLLASAAATANQRAVAGSADALAVDQGLPRPLTVLFPQQLGGALDGLSGELHAATPVALVESSRYVRGAALSRVIGARSPQDDPGQVAGVWVQAIGGNGTLDGNANTARTVSNSNGLLIGIDHEVGGWQLGLLLGTGRTDIRQAQGRASKARLDTGHAGVYAGRAWGGFGLRGGWAYSHHDVDTTREVAFAGYTDGLSATYVAKTHQAFIEAAYRIGDADAGVEPYLQVTAVKVVVGEVREKGGAAALRGTVSDSTTAVVSAGLRFNKGLAASFQHDAWLSVVGGLGYRRAAGDRNGQAQLAFDGGSGFAVSGAPMADSAVVAELGLSAWLSPRQQVELGYNGQFGSNSRDQGINARWSVRF